MVNKSKLYDISCDRKFIYFPASEGYDPNLATFFSGYVHVIGPTSDDGSGCSSSSASDLSCLYSSLCSFV